MDLVNAQIYMNGLNGYPFRVTIEKYHRINQEHTNLSFAKV